MSIYSVDKLIEQARSLASEYRKTTGKALPGVSNEIAEYDAARLLNLELCQDRSCGFDAVGRGGREGKRIQIKGRTIFDESKSGQRIGQVKVDHAWDSVVLVLMDENYQPGELYEACREDIMEYINKPSTSQKRRGAMSVSRFRIVGRLVWTRENGLEDEVWENRST